MIYLFPTFPMRSAEFRVDNIPHLREIYDDLLSRAEKVVSIDRNKLQVPEQKALVSIENTEQAHYACMLESLSIAAWAKNHLAPCTLSSFYSMGLFSALVNAGAIEFESALVLVRTIGHLAHQLSQNQSWSTGAIIRFPEEQLRQLIQQHAPELEISDFFDPDTILITGLTSSVKSILDMCLAQGAALTRLIPLSTPFHTSHLSSLETKIGGLLESLDFSAPQWPIVSSLTQRPLLSSDDIRREICQNIFKPMNWQATMETLLCAQKQATTIECGASHILSDTFRAVAPESWKCIDFRNPSIQ